MNERSPVKSLQFICILPFEILLFDFLADTTKQSNRACVILDLPVSHEDGEAVSAFFCEKMARASDAVFTYHRDRGMSRVILTGPEDQVAEILREYYRQQA